jgi:subtilisin family serine protease
MLNLWRQLKKTLWMPETTSMVDADAAGLWPLPLDHMAAEDEARQSILAAAPDSAPPSPAAAVPLHDPLFEGDDFSLQTNALADVVDPLANPLATQQWYLGAGSTPGALPGATAYDTIWSDYTGKGVTIGIVDSGFDQTHGDLSRRFDRTLAYDPRDTAGLTSVQPDAGSTDTHGTWVSGILGADGRNNYGMIGVAFDATLVGSYIRFTNGSSSRTEVAGLLSRQVNYDVMNASWGYRTQFQDNFKDALWADVRASVLGLAANGRDGLGTITVFAAGNDRQYVTASPSNDGDNTNYHSLTNARQIITVAAAGQDGNIASFSTPGASVLVGAAGVSIFTTDVQDNNGDANDDFVLVSGTSFAAPIVSGVTALMLEANPNLGYRDVQAILALTADHIGASAVWSTNGASNWNGGGMMYNHDFGYGVVDPRAAVRLAETWTSQQTAANEVSISAAPTTIDRGRIAEGGNKTFLINVPSGGSAPSLEWAELDLRLTHTHIGDIRVQLISPNGTVSTLIDRPGAGNNSRDNLDFTLTSAHFRGEAATGTWRVVVSDLGNGGFGNVEAVQLRLFGGAQDADTVHVFTDEFAELTARSGPITDRSGDNTLNLSALSSSSTVNLATGAGQIAGRAVQIDQQSTFGTLYGGDAHDRFTAGAYGVEMFGGRGNDTLSGGTGADVLSGGSGSDVFCFSRNFGEDTITDFQAGVDRLSFDRAAFGSFSHVMAAASQDGANVVFNKMAGGVLTLENVLLSNLSANDFLFV